MSEPEPPADVLDVAARLEGLEDLPARTLVGIDADLRAALDAERP